MTAETLIVSTGFGLGGLALILYGLHTHAEEVVRDRR